MSTLGQKQTFAVQNVMSALPPKADICSATRYVRFVPIAAITASPRNVCLPPKADITPARNRKTLELTATFVIERERTCAVDQVIKRNKQDRQ